MFHRFCYFFMILTCFNGYTIYARALTVVVIIVQGRNEEIDGFENLRCRDREKRPESNQSYIHDYNCPHVIEVI